MKAPKYVIYTDHFAKWNSEDKCIECIETKFIDVFEKTTELVKNDDTLCLIRIYEVVKGTRCKEYKRIANVRAYDRLEKIDGDIIKRHNEYNTVWYE